MNYAPIVRILIRYVVGSIIGADAASLLAGNPDVITVGALAVGAACEALYAVAKRKGWTT
jgi:glycerol-3-phosphate acyltransferase PlsY